MTIASPCVRRCQLTDEGLCLGCFRQIDEIARWMRLTDEEKAVVKAAAECRKRRCQNGPSNE